MTAHEVAEWVGLNIASALLIAMPRVDLPDLERGIEFVIKIIVAASVVALNVYKIRQVRKKNKPPTP